jgi:subtilase family serine protease
MRIRLFIFIGVMLLFSSIFALAALDLRFTTAISQTPDPANAGNTVTFTVSFKTFGDAVTNLKITGDVDGCGNFERTYASIDADKIRTDSFTWTATAGSHTVSFELDPDHTAGDSDYSNNRIVKVIVVSGGPTGQANLKPTVSYSPANFNAGDSVTFTINVQNIGSAPSPISMMGVYVDNAKVATYDTGILPAGGSQSYTYQWTVICGKKIRFEVDIKGSVTESNEGDNYWEKTFICFTGVVIEQAQFQKRPDLKAELIINPYPEVGGKMGVTLKVTNIGAADAPASEMAIQYGTHPPSTWPVPLLKPGRHYSIMDKKEVNSVGYYVISGFADYKNNIVESDEKNNSAFEKVVIKAPDLKFTNARVNKTGVRVQQEVRIWGTVKNVGDADAGPFEIQANFERCKLIAQGYKIKSVPGLATEKSIDFEFSHRFACLGKKVNYVIIDSKNAVKELNEQNNITLRIVVDVVVKPDIYQSDYNYVDTSHD